MTIVSEIPTAHNPISSVVMSDGKANPSVVAMLGGDRLAELAGESPDLFAAQVTKQTRQGFSPDISTTSMGAAQSIPTSTRGSDKGWTR